MTHTTLQTRILEPDQWEEFYSRLERAFGGPREPDGERAMWRDLTETERSLAVWDADVMVGTAGAFSFRMTVPGGEPVPAAGVTMVSVQPTHRRRGVLSGLMRRQLDDVRELGEPLAVLTASEPPIYGRYGYGRATRQARLSVDTSRVRLTMPPGADGVRLRLLPAGEAAAACEAVYARRVPERPGMLARRPGWERLAVTDEPARRAGAGELLCVLAERDGGTVGYARYAVQAEWSADGPDGTVVLRDIEALDPAALAALWRYLFGIDLTSRLTCANRPVDDPLLHLADDLRRCRTTTVEALYVRLVDVGAALAARRYAAPVDVVLDVEDAFCPWNSGRWRLTGDAGGAACERTADRADLTLSVRELGALYLGDLSAAELSAAGLLTEARPGSLAAVSTAFRSPVAPWLPHGF